MSAVGLRLITILCLSCTALSGPESGGVIWRDLGEDITIQCRSADRDPDLLILKKGLTEEQILVKDRESETPTIIREFMGRLQLNGGLPSMDILIKNLTSNDTGPYWCFYSKFVEKSQQPINKKGTGSVLLVVSDTAKQCEPVNKDLVLVSVVISGAVLLGIIMGILVWIIKAKTVCSKVKPRRVNTNDVYEDMRGTLRR